MHFLKGQGIAVLACLQILVMSNVGIPQACGQVNSSVPPVCQNGAVVAPTALGGGVRGPWESGGLKFYIYDSDPFTCFGPRVFTDLSLWMLPENGQGDAFDHPAWEVVMGSSVNDYRDGGTATQSGPSNVILSNYSTDRTVVRPLARWHSNQEQVIGWASMKCRRPFYWDPSLGLDLIIQIAGCGFPTDPYRRRVVAASSVTPPGANSYWRVGSGICGNPFLGSFDSVSAITVGCESFPAVGVVSSFGHDFARATAPTEFWERCWTGNPGGITSWQWDFGDGTTDTGPSPFHTFACAGSYLVRLVATDAGGLTRLYERSVVVSPQPFTLETQGMGDLTITGPGIACVPTGVRGHTLISGTTIPGQFGTGTFYGLTLDQGTLWTLTQPPGVNNPFHFWASPGAYPDVPFVYPAGTFTLASGIAVDAVLLYLDFQGTPVFTSNVAQVIL